MAFWAFSLGYLISSLIQVLIPRSKMQATMGESGPGSIALGTFFGFISSSCSFAALSTTRALFQKGAGLAPAMSFLLASTNLVIELGIVIAIFLGWQFIVGEYAGGVLLILFAWGFIRVTNPHKLITAARKRLSDSNDAAESTPDPVTTLTSVDGWRKIGQTYFMEWQMVWKDVLIGFTLAGVISAFVPAGFFAALFVGSGQGAGDPGIVAVSLQALVAPVAAFFTFIGSMGNIPLAALLSDHGVSFAGIMAFIFSDLVVLPVLRINAGYYGWKLSLYILAMLLSGLVFTAIALHYGLAWLQLLPDHSSNVSIVERDFFQLNYTAWFNLLFLGCSVLLLGFARRNPEGSGQHEHQHGGKGRSVTDRALLIISLTALGWLVSGLGLSAVV